MNASHHNAARYGQHGPDLWEYVIIGFIIVAFVLSVKSCVARAAPDCKPRLVAGILKCDASGCLVLLPNGTKGQAQFPVEPGKESVVCQ